MRAVNEFIMTRFVEREIFFYVVSLEFIIKLFLMLNWNSKNFNVMMYQSLNSSSLTSNEEKLIRDGDVENTIIFDEICCLYILTCRLLFISVFIYTIMT